MENGFQGGKTMQGSNNTVSTNYGRQRSWVEILLRILGLCLTLIAAVIVGVDKQSTVVPISVISTLPPLNIPVTAKSKYLSAFVYFVAANAVACAYAAVSLLHPVMGSKRSCTAAVLVIMDMLVAALLVSSNGAAAAIGLMGYEGNSHVRWKKVCNVFDKFCNHVAVALALSFLACLVFLFLVARAVWRLHKR